MAYWRGCYSKAIQRVKAVYSSSRSITSGERCVDAKTFITDVWPRIDGCGPKAPAGALGVVYGDFFPQDGEEDVGFMNIRHIGTIPPYPSSNSYSLSSIANVYLYYCSYGEGEDRGRLE